MNNRTNMSQPNWLWVVAALVIGGILGWALAYFVFPPTFVDSPPWYLNDAGKSEWVTMVADSYSLNQDLNGARERLRGFTTAEIQAQLTQEFTERNQKGDAIGAAAIQGFAQTLNLDVTAPPGTGTGQDEPSQPPASSRGLLDNPGLLLLILAGVVLLVALGLFFYMRMRTAPTFTPRRAAMETASAGGGYTDVAAPTYQAVPVAPLREQPVTAPPMTTGAPASRAAPAAAARSLGTFAATYKFGEDNYDTSFTLETARGEFLGECGMGSSETIGEGKPDKVTAFDVWLFDKTDVRTVTQILMSEWAYNDQATRARLATKGELLLAEKGKSVRLETATLVVDAEIVDLVYASTPGQPPNSHFQKLIVEMVPTQR
jgi:hypothetical protein